jgi:hypothetical protein
MTSDGITHRVVAPPRVMAGPGPATHDFPNPMKASRGWPACAGHDGWVWSRA